MEPKKQADVVSAHSGAASTGRGFRRIDEPIHVSYWDCLRDGENWSRQ
jgi:hypothetical protein